MKHKERNQTVLIITICTMICFTPIVHFINQLFRLIIGAGFTLDTLVCYSILAGMLLASLRQLHFKVKTDVMAVLLLFVLSFVLSYSFIHNNKLYMFTQWTDFAGNPMYLLFVYSLPAYVYMRYVTDFDRMFEICHVFSEIVVFCSLGSFVLMFLRDSQPEYMSFSDNLVFPTIISLVYYFEKRKVMPLITALTGTILIFFAGARGPLACVVFSLAAYFLISKASAKKKVFLVCFIIVGTMIVMLMWQPILSALKDSVDSIGISSRTIDLLMEGEIFSDSSRGEIQKKIIDGFSLIGSGLYGDRALGDDHYAHNLIIELIAQWGYLIGAGLLTILCGLFIKGFRTKNTSLQLLIMVLFSSSVVKLMFSGSYLAHNASFFVLIAACVNSLELEDALPVAENREVPKKKSKYIKTYRRYSS